MQKQQLVRIATRGRTSLILADGNDYARDCHAQVLAVPARLDLSFPARTNYKTEKVRRNVFSLAEGALVGQKPLAEEIIELQKILKSGSGGLGRYARRSNEDRLLLEPGSVVITGPGRIFTLTMMETRWLYHMAMVTDGDCEFNKEVLKKAVSNSLLAAMNEGAQEIAFPLEVSFRRETGGLGDRAFQMFMATLGFLNQFLGKHSISKIMFYMHNIRNNALVADVEKSFTRFFG